MDNKTVELKRIVMVKAVVTEAFKDNLIKELERALGNMDLQGQQLEMQSKQYAADLKKRGQAAQLATFKKQYQDEQNRMGASKADLQRKIQEARTLVVGTEFVQGPLEGPVTVTIGDNLYKKVGGAEIIVKDGTIQEIRGLD